MDLNIAGSCESITSPSFLCQTWHRNPIHHPLSRLIWYPSGCHYCEKKIYQQDVNGDFFFFNFVEKACWIPPPPPPPKKKKPQTFWYPSGYTSIVDKYISPRCYRGNHFILYKLLLAGHPPPPPFLQLLWWIFNLNDCKWHIRKLNIPHAKCPLMPPPPPSPHMFCQQIILGNIFKTVKKKKSLIYYF